MHFVNSVDPVARFHLRNGAILKSIRYLANSSADGVRQSASLMVNYVYIEPSSTYIIYNESGVVSTGQLSHDVEARRMLFDVSFGNIPVSEEVGNMLM